MPAGPLPSVTDDLSNPHVSRTKSWYAMLMSNALLVVDLPLGALLTDEGAPFDVPGPMQALFVRFCINGGIKSTRRPERFHRLEIVPALATATPLLGVVPVLTHRVSPEAELRDPTIEDDTQVASEPFETAADPPELPPLVSVWPVPFFQKACADYPDPVVRGLSVSVMKSKCDPYVGDITKPVNLPNAKLRPGENELFRAKAMEGVNAQPHQLTAGPFKLSPFPNARNCPFQTELKDKYDLTSERRRAVANFSKVQVGHGKRASVNGLCKNPRLITTHMTAGTMRDQAAWLFEQYGPGVYQVSGDIPACFRRNFTALRLRCLQVYRIVTTEFGTEFFVDLANPFGWTVSEWGHQTTLAMMLWVLRQRGLGDTLAFVDNFFLIRHHGHGPTLQRTQVVFDRAFSDMGVPLHERSSGATLEKGLGWMWDFGGCIDASPGRPTMICAEDKYGFFCRILAAAREVVESEKPFMSLKEVEKIVGFMNFIKDGFPMGRGHMGGLRHVLASGSEAAHRQHVSASRYMCKLDGAAAEAVRFWHVRFSGWDRRCPAMMGFSPLSPAEYFGRVDAAPLWGCGGICYNVKTTELQGFYHKWTAAEAAEALEGVQVVSTGVVEAYGARFWAQHFLPQCKGSRVHLEMDNEAAVCALRKAYSPKLRMLEAVRGVWEAVADGFICLRVVHILGAIFNKVADALSRGWIAEAKCLARAEFGVELQLLLL